MHRVPGGHARACLLSACPPRWQVCSAPCGGEAPGQTRNTAAPGDLGGQSGSRVCLPHSPPKDPPSQHPQGHLCTCLRGVVFTLPDSLRPPYSLCLTPQSLESSTHQKFCTSGPDCILLRPVEVLLAGRPGLSFWNTQVKAGEETWACGKSRDWTNRCRKKAAVPHEAPSGKGTKPSWLVDNLFELSRLNS